MNTQTDRELLELAAKAAGFPEVVWQDMRGWGEIRHGYSEAIWTGEYYWNPLTNNGDALRLAVKLDIQVFQDQEEDGPAACAGYWGKPWRRDVSRLFIVETYASSANKGSPHAATRRAIVRAAAALGEAQCHM